jgi:hypothetical protein
MATLVELRTLITNPTLAEKVESAILIIAEEVRVESDATANHANRVKLAKAIFNDSTGWRDNFLRAMLAANSAETLTNIQNASDAAILTATRNAWNVFADGTDA